MVNSETLKLYTFKLLYWSSSVQQNCSFIWASATSAACWGYARVDDQCLTSHWPTNIHSIKTQRQPPTSQLADHPWSAHLHVTVLDWMKQKILANWPPTTEVWTKRTRNSQSLKRCLARGAMGAEGLEEPLGTPCVAKLLDINAGVNADSTRQNWLSIVSRLFLWSSKR